MGNSGTCCCHCDLLPTAHVAGLCGGSCCTYREGSTQDACLQSACWDFWGRGSACPRCSSWPGTACRVSAYVHCSCCHWSAVLHNPGSARRLQAEVATNKGRAAWAHFLYCCMQQAEAPASVDVVCHVRGAVVPGLKHLLRVAPPPAVCANWSVVVWQYAWCAPYGAFLPACLPRGVHCTAVASKQMLV